MVITNELTPKEVLAELPKGRRTSANATKRFAALRHDRHLVPHFRFQIDSILDVYKAYRTDAYDIQDMRDDGVDVLLRFQQNDESYRLRLQVKSNEEFDQWAKKKSSMVKDLKAQYSAATENARVNDYYVLICANEKDHRKRIRTICSEFKNYRRCTVIEPRDALGFYEMSETDLLIRTTRLLCNTDTILREAMSEADSKEPAVAFFLASLVSHGFECGLNVDQTNLSELLSNWSKLAKEAAGLERSIEGVTQDLLGSGVLEYNGADYAIDATRLPVPLCALHFDLRVRDLVYGTSIRDYIVGLLELEDQSLFELENYDKEFDDDEE